MTMKLSSIAISVLLAGIPVVPAWAISLPQAVEQAVLRNPEVQVRWHQFLSSDKELTAAKGAYLPRIDASAYTGREWRDYPRAAGGNFSFSQPGAQIELRQMLFDGFATRSNVRLANYQSQTRYYELLSVSDSVALDAAQAYLDVLRYRRLVELARDNWAIHKELYDQIAERVQAGIGRRVDLEQAAGRLALAESNWLTEEANLHDVSARYERYMGELPGKDMDAAPSLLTELPKSEDALGLALNKNPGFLAAIANLRSARAQLDGQKSANYPTIELRASEGYDRNENGVSGNYRKGVIQLSLNYNLFRGGADHARTQAAGESLNAAFDQRDKICRDIRQETRIAQSDVRKLAEQIKYLDQHQLSTEKARDAYRKQFDIGQRTLLDLLDTENELFEAKRSLVRAEVDYQLSQVRLLTQTHQILPALKLTSLAKEEVVEDQGGAEADDARVACQAQALPELKLDHAAAMASRPPHEALPVVKPAPAAMVPAVASQCLEKDIAPQLEAWRSAWASKDADRYLDFYSARFEPAKGQKLADWKISRRSRLAASGQISLALEQTQSKLMDGSSAQVHFLQRYQSVSYSDNTNKILDLSCEAGKWKIIRELVNTAK